MSQCRRSLGFIATFSPLEGLAISRAGLHEVLPRGCRPPPLLSRLSLLTLAVSGFLSPIPDFRIEVMVSRSEGGSRHTELPRPLLHSALPPFSFGVAPTLFVGLQGFKIMGLRFAIHSTHATTSERTHHRRRRHDSRAKSPTTSHSPSATATTNIEPHL